VAVKKADLLTELANAKESFADVCAKKIQAA